MDPNVTRSQREPLKPLRSLRNALLAAGTAAAAACASAPPLPFVLLPPEFAIDESFAPEGGIAGPAGRAAASVSPAVAPPPAAALSPTPREPKEGPEGPSQIPFQVPFSGDESVALRVRILYLAQPPSDAGLRPAATGTAIVADLVGSEPVAETPDLTAQVLFADGPVGAAWLEEALAEAHVTSIAYRSFELPTGASYRLGMTVMETIEDPRDWLDEFADRGPIPRRLGLEVFAGDGEITIAIEITDVAPAAERALREAILENPHVPPGPPPAAHTEVLRREAVTLDASIAAGGPVAIRVPSPFETGTGTTFVLVVETAAPSGVFVSSEEAQARVTLDAMAQAARSVPLTDKARKVLEREEALSAFRGRGGRAALLLLAEESDAPLCADLALCADAGFLAALAERAFPGLDDSQQGSTPEEHVAPEAIGWRLDATAWSIIAEAAIEETITPELEGVFFRRAGALARFPDIIQDLLRNSRGDLGAFERGLITEHLIALEDSSDSVRLRAHDWLMERGLAVPDFVPLAGRAERRAALESHRDRARQGTAPKNSTDPSNAQEAQR